MEISIYNDDLLRKVFNRRIKKPVTCCVGSFMDHLSMKKKIDFTLRRLEEITFQSARIVIEYWSDLEKLTRLLRRYQLYDYTIIRPYKNNRIKAGVLNIYIHSGRLNHDFLRVMLNKHYGHDFSTPDSIEITPYVIFDTGKNEIIAFKLYDDRGYYEYYIQKGN